jgi:hypothetical protein
MKIKLNQDVPVEPKHGMTKDREIQVISTATGGFYVKGDTGESILVLKRECEIIEDQ